MLRRRTIGSKKLVFFQKRFYPAGNYTWTVPAGCREVDVFLVGGGGGSGYNGNAAAGARGTNNIGGVSDYKEGSGNGGLLGGGGYGGGAGATSLRGGDGTVLIRYWAYEE